MGLAATALAEETATQETVWQEEASEVETLQGD